MSKNHKFKPPSLANWLAARFMKETLLEEFLGDLEEIYQDRVSAQGKFYAKQMYWIDVLHLLMGFSSLYPFKSQNNLTIMYKHYLIVSGRNLLRNRVFSLINIFGLAMGMGVCLLIYQYIHFELSYDKFHTNAQNIYRLTQTDIRNGEDSGTSVYTTYALGARCKEIIPEIKDFVRIRPDDTGPVIANNEDDVVFQEDKVWYVDGNFLQLFDFPLRYGDRESALDKKYQIVLTEQMAIKYFGDCNPLGKELKFSLGSLSGDFIVTGILKSLPINSHLQFDFLLPMKLLVENHQFYRESDSGGWGLNDFVTYIVVDKIVDLIK